MRKRIFLIIFIIAFIVWVLYFISSLFTPSKQKNHGVLPTPTEAEKTISLPKAPGDKLIISGVKTNDFLSSPIKINSQGDVVFVKTADYQTTYLKNSSQFIINISTTSAKARDDAESAFLKKLGISKDEACKLNVFVSAPYIPNPYLSVQRRTLSFCVNY